MTIELIWVGRTHAGFIEEGVREYQNRLKHYARLTIKELPDIKQAKNLSREQIKEAEGRLILGLLSPSDYLVLLDERGQQRDSVELAQWIGGLLNRSTRKLSLVVGGAYGFSPEVYQRADEKLSLSRLTFSHQLIRIVFTEQLYRAFTILRGEPYHHA